MKSDTIFFGILAKSAFSGLSEYYERSESLLESAKKEGASRINEEVNKLARDFALSKDEEYGEWVSKMQDHETTYDMLFTNFFRYSFIVLAYLVLEDHLHRFCIALQDAKGLAEAPPIPKGNIIKTYRNYVDRAKVSVQDGLWEGVEDLRFIRNCITHSSGNVARSSYQSDLYRIAQKNVGIYISRKFDRNEMTPLYLQDNMIMIESKYCKSVVRDMQVLFETMCKAANSMLGKLLESIFYLVDNDESESEDEKYVTLTFYTTREENLFAHQLLAVMAFGTAILSNDKLNWLEVIKNNKFRMDYLSVRSAFSKGIEKGAIAAIIKQNPVVRPQFLQT
ncbi:unnamed protein product [marine sediment metagenome]|uniref:Uncharacterized protein n=1 Tax=marine sediment metagenome TaxID=412755 RepID=X0YPX6_9ZZZZ